MRKLILLVGLILSPPAAAESLSGTATIVDGDTVTIADRAVHLYGIDAPEMDQFCTDKKGKRFNCGHTAMRRLFLYIGADPLDCVVRAHRPDGSLAATCHVKSYFRRTENGATRGEKFDVALEMVLTGHAFADRQTTHAYAEAEEQARRRKMGLLAGQVTPPWEWRSRTRQDKK